MAEKKQVRLTTQQVVQAYQVEQAKLQAVRSRKEQLQELLRETIGAEQALKDISTAKKDGKIMVSAGAGVYIEARLASTKEVKTGLGGGVLINSTIEKALEEIAKRKEEIQKDVGQVQREEARLMQNLSNLGLAIESARQKAVSQKPESQGQKE